MAAGQRDATRLFPVLTVGFVAVVWLITLAKPDGPTAVMLFTLVLLVHGTLHAFVGLAASSGKRATGYVAVQAALLMAAAALAPGQDLVIALFFPLMGETMGLFPARKERLTALALLAAVWFPTLLLTLPRATLSVRLPVHALSLLFVGIYVTLYMRQTRERERAEDLLKQLEQAHGQLRAYAVQVEELSVTEERHRMARELHDTLAQGLAGLIMQLEAVDSLLEQGDPARAKTVTRRAMDRARATLKEARTAISALRSPLDRGDLAEAIRRQIEVLQADSGIAFTLEVGPGDLRVDEGLRLQLYRVAQEGLANAVRHSRAANVQVKLQAADSAVRLEIVDDGVGFDPDAAPRPGHYGLIGLQERIRLAGGELRIESRPGAGTRLLVTLPIPVTK